MIRRTIVLLLISVSSLTFAQFPPSATNELLVGGGMTWINNEPFYTFHLRPELSFSKIGLGLDLNLEFDSHGNLRKENFNEFSDYASIIRYLRYGSENEDAFIKLGALDYLTLGHGSIISAYNNSPSYDARKVGLALYLDFGKFGFQSMYGNFGQAGVVGIRGAVRPLQFSSLADVPILGNLELGATYAGDFDNYARVDSITSLTPLLVGARSPLTILGADVGIPIVRGDVAEIQLFFDYSKILDFGSGTSAGVLFNVRATDALTLRSRIARLFNGDHYLPMYFNSFYELERFNTVTGASKSYALAHLNNVGNGYYGDLLVRILNTFDIIGSYQKLDDADSSGIVHVATNLSPQGSPIVVRAGYDKVNIAGWKDLVTTDERSLLFAEVGYKPIEYVIMSTRYLWTFTPLRDSDGHVIGYEPQKRIEPRITFVIPLP